MLNDSPLRPITLSWDHCLPVSGLDSIKSYLADTGGVYLWLFNGKPLRVAYVGETEKFLKRIVEHLTFFQGSAYSSFDLSADDDYIRFLKEHFLTGDKAGVAANPLIYSPFNHAKPEFSFTRAFGDESVRKMHAQYIKNSLFAFARIQTDLEVTASLRREVEGTLLIGLRDFYTKELQIKNAFKMPFGTSADTPLGRISQKPGPGIQLTHVGSALSALPREVIAITSERL